MTLLHIFFQIVSQNCLDSRRLSGQKSIRARTLNLDFEPYRLRLSISQHNCESVKPKVGGDTRSRYANMKLFGRIPLLNQSCFKIIYFLDLPRHILSHGICLQTFFSEFGSQAISRSLHRW